MSEIELITKLADALAVRIRPRIPASVQLWDLDDIAEYLRLSKVSVQSRIACLPDFPKAIRLPTDGKKSGHPRYKAAEVISWAEHHQEK